MNIAKKSSPLLLFFGSAWLWGCATLTAPFDPVALEQAVTLKTRALTLMSKATGPLSAQEAEVGEVRRLMDAAAAHAASRPKNSEGSRQWELMRNPEGNLLGGYLKRWQSAGPLNPAFVNEAQGLVRNGFDAIIGLEEARRR